MSDKIIHLDTPINGVINITAKSGKAVSKWEEFCNKNGFNIIDMRGTDNVSNKLIPTQEMIDNVDNYYM